MKTTKSLFFKVGICMLAVLMLAGVVFTALTLSGSDKPLVDIPMTDLAATYKGEIKDADGNLLVPFDVAYPEVFASGCEYEKDVLLLKLEEGFGNHINANLLGCGFSAIEKFLGTDEGDWFRATLNADADIMTAIKKARSLPEVLVADFNYIYKTEEIDYDTVLASTEADGNKDPFDCSDKVKENNHWKDQYNLGKNKVQEAWKFLKENGVNEGGSSSVIVAVIDTGVDYTHPDLKANMWVNKGEIPDNNIDDDGNGYVDDVYGCNTTGAEKDHSGNPMDDHGHGTHVAGIIGATNNKEGVVGIAYNTKIMAVKAGQATGVFNQSDIAEAILYAYQMGADVINMSFGGSACSIAVQDALTSAYTTAILVAAAGNDGMPNEGSFSIPSYPAALSYVIGVMSVDKNGVESSFTNYDVYAFNAIEYEVYAPGEQIMSTLPDGRYGKLSGTSMAAPVVSAAAALLRSYYTDRDMYPSKFIAAQLCATSEEVATCLDPKAHGLHNIPMMLNIIDALTKLPKPDIQVFDFYVFDPVSYNGTLYARNNGDGVADAGETLLIGIVLRNRWGMSKDTIVTINTLSSGEVSNPYVEIIDGEVNFEGVGTYSTKSTLVYNEENIITGITDPFIIKLDEDCPNDFRIGINVYMSYKNGLDEKDETTYTYGEPGRYDVQFWARSGLVLPSQITEDMTLTKDNYYIIPNSTYIHEGVTVTVEPGTQIQFWSDDPSDPYAETYIAYLNVAGSFICQGTEDEPVELFPSEMMTAYQVAIEQTTTGTVNMSYTTVTNPVIETDYIDHCTFKYNYARPLYYRHLNGGKVETYEYGYGYLCATVAKNCLFYKCGADHPMLLRGDFDTCSFVDSRIETNLNHFTNYNVYQASKYWRLGPTSFTNCVFMGNSATDEGGVIYNSKITVYNPGASISDIVRNKENGTSYIAITGCSSTEQAYVLGLAKSLGGDIACFETEEEWEFIKSQRIYGHVGIMSENDTTWDNGSLIGDFIEIGRVGPFMGYFSGGKIEFCLDGASIIIEIPGSIYLDNITLDEREIKIDDETSYQIHAEVIPPAFDKSGLVYVSEDESVAKVSDSGRVTPVSKGTTRIFVYSPDYMVYDVMRVEVIEKVPVNDVIFERLDCVIEVGDSAMLKPVFSPNNTTEKEVKYTSSSPDIASVDEYGVITAHRVGNVTITATAYNGSTDNITVRVSHKVQSIAFDSVFYTTSLGDTDEGWRPVISPVDATDYTIVYESSNREVAYVDDEGRLVRVSNGIATIRATVEGSGLYDELLVSVSDTDMAPIGDVICMDSASPDGYNRMLAVTADGSLWVWGESIKLPMRIASGVKSAVFGHFNDYNSNFKANYISYIDNSGNLKELSLRWSHGGVDVSDNAVKYSFSNLSMLYSYHSSYYALTEDGTVWVVGKNDYGQLGIGNTTDISTPVYCAIADVKEIVAFSCTAAFLKKNGELYVAGTSNNKYTTPTLVDTGVVDIRAGESYAVIYDKVDGSQYHLDYSYATPNLIPESYGKVHYYGGMSDSFSNYSSAIYFKDGKVYRGNTVVEGIKDPVKMFYCNSAFFVITESGEVYAFGSNSLYQLGDLTKIERYERGEKLFFGIEADKNAPLYSGTNVYDGILKDEVITIDFDKAISAGTAYASITLKDSAGNLYPVTKEIYLDKLIITPLIPLTNGCEYSVAIPRGAVSNLFGYANTDDIIVAFTYLDNTKIELIDSNLKDGDILKDGVLGAEIEYTLALIGDAFDRISLTLDGATVEGLTVTLDDGVLKLSHPGLAPGEYILTLPAGALKDNVGGVNGELVYNLKVPVPEEEAYLPLQLVHSSLIKDECIALNPEWIVVVNKEFILDGSLVALVDSDGTAVDISLAVDGDSLIIRATGLSEDTRYTLAIAEGAITDEVGAKLSALTLDFTTVKYGEQFYYTSDYLSQWIKDYASKGLNGSFTGNAILNNFNDTNVEHWLRLQANTGTIGDRVGAGVNWWGTLDREMIERQILDFDDYQSLLDIVLGDYLTTAPENTFPFVTAAYLINSSGERVDRVGNERVTFVIEFNRDMDTTIPLRVRFGSSLPYAEYEISGEYVNARRWEGTYTLKTTIENGRQFIRIENGVALDDSYLGLYETPGRFGFELDTTAAQALTMLGEATETGIKLTWVQDDFDTLAGYNVYRSTSEDGKYERLNSYVIPVDIKEFFDDTVEPGKRYYYNFTVVKTDLTESIPSGKITIMSMDTMAPNIYHTPVRTAYTGANLLISATVTDNLGVDTVIVHYRTVGSEEWHDVVMSVLNSRYTGLIPAEHIDTLGFEYYIEARDGRNSTYKGSADVPYQVVVKLAVDENALGDVDGDGMITNKDALMLLQAVNDLLNLTEEQFLRADINKDGELSAAEALKILQYVSGKITSIVG